MFKSLKGWQKTESKNTKKERSDEGLQQEIVLIKLMFGSQGKGIQHLRVGGRFGRPALGQ
jgi:hypothetical protein